MGTPDIFSLLQWGVDLLWVAIDLVVLVLILRTWKMVQHPALIYLGMSCVLSLAAVTLNYGSTLLAGSPEVYDKVWLTIYVMWTTNAIVFFISMWLLFRWIPQLLELRALDQRDAPFEHPPA